MIPITIRSRPQGQGFLIRLLVYRSFPDAAEIPQQLFILHGFVRVFIPDSKDHAGDCQPDRAEQQRQDGQQLRADPLPGKHVVEEIAFGLLRRAVQVQAQRASRKQCGDHRAQYRLNGHEQFFMCHILLPFPLIYVMKYETS